MDKRKEELFADVFLEKRIRDRIKFELSSPKYREAALWRFCHNTEDVVKQPVVHLKSHKISEEELYQELRKLSSSKTGYILSLDERLDGRTFPLEQAVSECFYSGLAEIVILDEHTAFVNTEQVKGASEKYILHVKGTRG